MKTFRGTLLLLVALVAMAGAYFYAKPKELTPIEKKELREKGEGIPLFIFEKADLVRVEVKRPDTTIVLVEKDDGWWIESENLRAAKNMVNRVKHQFHDLMSRATVVQAGSGDALYGLGESAIHVTLGFRDGSTRSFSAGDPNPSGVSFYIRPDGSEKVYTVKKSAIDYYSLGLSEFRERRFATFDSKDVDTLEATLPGGKRLKFQRAGEHAWDMLQPRKMPASDSEVRSLLGRVSAMKAIKFVTDDPAEAARLGLDKPRALVTVGFASRAPVELRLGERTGEMDGEYALAYAQLGDERSVYAVRDGLLEDYTQDPESFRLTRYARIDQNDLVSLTSTYSPTDADDLDLAGTVTVKHAAGQWQWDDGVLVPGSTPRRVASRACDINSDEFVAESGPDAKFGFDTPLARVVMLDDKGTTRTLLVGKKATPKVDPEGHERDRYYARAVEFPEIYIVDRGLVDVLEDLAREHGRHARGEEEQSERQQRIEKEMGAPPGLPDRPGMPPGLRGPGRPGKDAPDGKAKRP